jgi:hypothetical protein
MKRNLIIKLHFDWCIFEFNLCSNEFLQETVSSHALISGFIRNLRGEEEERNGEQSEVWV